jgi:hypothetical protein
LFLVFIPIPPVLFFIVEHHLFAGRRRLGVGLALGLLVVAQYFISSEVLVATALLLAVTAAIVGTGEVARRRRVWPRLRGAAPMLAVGAIPVLVVLGYPVWYALRGREHLLGRTQPQLPGIDVLSALLPATHRLVGGRWPGLTMSTLGPQGDMAFVGVPLLVILACVVVAERRSPVVRFAAVFGTVAWVFALGPHLLIDGHQTKVPLPFSIVEHLPLLWDLVPGRLMLFVDMAAAVILAVGTDRVMTLATDRGRLDKARFGSWRSRRGAAIAMGMVGLIFVVPVTAYPTAGTGVAGYFLNGAASRTIPLNGVVLAYPYPKPPQAQAQAMIWQADSGLRFSLLGGDALRPFPVPQQDKLPAMLSPKAVLDILLGAWPATLPGSTSASLAEAEAELPAFAGRYHVTTILVDLAGRQPQRVVAMCRAVYGPPLRYGRLLVWHRLHLRRA